MARSKRQKYGGETKSKASAGKKTTALSKESAARVLQRRIEVLGLVVMAFATVLALAELPFLPISTEAAFVGELPRVPFLLPGSRDLAESVVEALGKGVAVLMQNHGLVVAGSTLRRALDLTLVIEHTAESLVACHRLGREPSVIPDHIATELREVGVMMG